MPSPYRLVAFDMDGTLIQQEVIDEIARLHGVADEVSKITATAMNGGLDFTASLRARCRLLSGCPASVFDTLRSTGIIQFTPGVQRLCASLKKAGFKLAVLSGGFIPLALWVKAELGLDYAYANDLEVSEDGKTLTGKVKGDIVHAERKATLIEEIAAKEGISLEESVAVGDGANDLVMMQRAGLGIAYNAKPIVQQKAPKKINSETILDIIYLLGFEREELERLGIKYDAHADAIANGRTA